MCKQRAMAYRKCTSPVWEFFEPPTVMKVNGKDINECSAFSVPSNSLMVEKCPV